MRILLVNKFWYPKGGSERYAFLIKNLLESHGHDVVPFAMEDERNLPTPWSEFFVPHVDFWEAGDAVPNQVRGLEKLKTVLWNRAAAERLEKLLQEWKPDVAHLQNFSHQISPSILPVLARHGIPIIWTLHDYELLCPNYRMYTKGSPCERCKGRRYWNALRFNCMGNCAASAAVALEHSFHAMSGVYRKHIDTIIAPSRFLAGKLAEWGWKGKVEVVPNFISAGEMITGPVAADPHRARDRSARGGGPPLRATRDHASPVLFVGRLQEEKGVGDFIEAAEKCPDIPFEIIGDGPLAGETRKRMTRVKNILWHGALSAEETMKRIAAARIVIVPSRWYENAPYVVLEAMAAGVPIIASRIGGLPELVREAETGLLVQPRDVGVLAKAIRELYNDPLRCQAMGDQAQEIIQADYGSDRHYERIIGIYSQFSK